MFSCFIFAGFNQNSILAQGVVSISFHLCVGVSKRPLCEAMLKLRRAAITWSRVGGELHFLKVLKLDISILGIDDRERTDEVILLPDL